MARASVRVEINQRELRAFLKSGELSAAMRPFAQRIKTNADAGSGSSRDHEIREFVGHDRVSLIVATATPEAMVAEMRDRNLTRAVESGRG